MIINPFSISCLILAITTFCVIFITLFYSKRMLIHRLWVLFSFSVFLWATGAFFISQIRGDELFAVFLWKFTVIGVIFSPILLFHVIYVLCGLTNKKILILIYIQGFLAVIVGLMGHLSHLKFVFDSFYYPVSRGYAYPLLYSTWILIVSYAHYELFKHYRMATGIKRNQLRYVFIGTAIGFVGAAMNFFPVFGIMMYPYSNFLPTIYCITVTYAILRHQLMDIEVVIKKSLVFSGMFAFIFGVVVIVAYLVGQLFGGGNLLSLAISALIITFSLRPIESWLVNSTDKFLFQKKYEYKQILKTFIDNVITELNLDEIISSTLKLLGQTLHPYAASIFILNKVDDKYQLYNAFGLEDKELTFTSDSKIVAFLKKTHSPAVIKQINGIFGVNPEISFEMSTIKAVLVFPLMLHEDLIGFIALGKKKSDEDYTKDDLDVLQDLVRTESIAVGNAQLLREAAQAERRAAIGTMAAGIHHEIGNPLNIINTKIQLFLTGAERGFYKDKTKEEVVQECSFILNETIKQTNRIAEITKKLSNFAKPGREFKPEVVNVSQQIDEVLAIVGHDLELERIKINKEISSDTNKILADKGETQQIFFNIIRNAGQAIEGPGTITIRVFSDVNGKVRIEIQDTGKGIPEDKTYRVFEPFFTTKGPNKGTGLGLSIVRQLVWKNKGEIFFRSQVGIGTTFALEFPKASG